MHVAMGRYASEYPAADVVLFEPAQDDPDMFFVNVLRYADRRRLCEHAYQHTRRELLRRYEELAPIFARHGVTINRAVLADTSRTLLPALADGSLASTLQDLDTTLDRLAGALAQPHTFEADEQELDEAVPV
jgi:hypothetical protein